MLQAAVLLAHFAWPPIHATLLACFGPIPHARFRLATGSLLRCETLAHRRSSTGSPSWCTRVVARTLRARAAAARQQDGGNSARSARSGAARRWRSCS